MLFVIYFVLDSELFDRTKVAYELLTYPNAFCSTVCLNFFLCLLAAISGADDGSPSGSVRPRLASVISCSALPCSIPPKISHTVVQKLLSPRHTKAFHNLSRYGEMKLNRNWLQHHLVGTSASRYASRPFLHQHRSSDTPKICMPLIPTFSIPRQVTRLTTASKSQELPYHRGLLPFPSFRVPV